MEVKYVQYENILDFALKTQAEHISHLALH